MKPSSTGCSTPAVYSLAFSLPSPYGKMSAAPPGPARPSASKGFVYGKTSVAIKAMSPLPARGFADDTAVLPPCRWRCKHTTDSKITERQKGCGCTCTARKKRDLATLSVTKQKGQKVQK